MQRVAIYNPGRVPPDRVNLLHTGQFAVFFQDVQTSVVLNADGAPWAADEAQSCFVFDSLAEAKQYCHELVESADHVRCDIFDERGMAVEPLYMIVNKRHERRIGTRASARWLMLSGVLAIMLSVPLCWYDWLSRGARLWPAIFGINLFFAGVRLLLWGYGELERLRQREVDQASVEAQYGSPDKAGE